MVAANGTAKFEWGAWCTLPGTSSDAWLRSNGDWLQSFAFADPASGLALVIRGTGGGSQQATFRDTLEAYVTRAVTQWKKGPPGALVARLTDLRLELQRQFEAATEPFYANHFQALWAAVLMDDTGLALTNLGLQRVYAFDSSLRRLSVDDRLRVGELELELTVFGTFGQAGREPAIHQSRVWAPHEALPPLLVLISGLGGKPHLTDERLGALVAQSVSLHAEDGLERTAQSLFELIAADGPDERSGWFRHGVVAFVRPRAALR